MFKKIVFYIAALAALGNVSYMAASQKGLLPEEPTSTGFRFTMPSLAKIAAALQPGWNGARWGLTTALLTSFSTQDVSNPEKLKAILAGGFAGGLMGSMAGGISLLFPTFEKSVVQALHEARRRAKVIGIGVGSATGILAALYMVGPDKCMLFKK